MSYKENLEAALRGRPMALHRAQRRQPRVRPVPVVARKPAPADRRLNVAKVHGLLVFLVTLLPLMIAVTPLVRFVSQGRDRAFRRMLSSATALGVTGVAVLVGLAHYGVVPGWAWPAAAAVAVIGMRMSVLPLVLIWGDTVARHPLVRW